MYPPENKHVPTIFDRKWIICTQPRIFQNGGSPPDALPPQVDEAAQGTSRSAALEDWNVKLAGFAPEK